MNHAVELMTPAELDELPRDVDASFGSLATDRGHLPLRAMDVHARAVGLDVRIELRQTFANHLAEPIEATYIFPLPDRAAVTGFRLRVGERVIEGVIDERGQARQNYDEAIRAGHRAAIAEEERPDVFTVRVGNLMPGQRAEVQIDLVGSLAVDRNEATFRFPLVVAPRYIPGAALPGESVGEGTASDTDAVPDASRITPPVLLPGYPTPVGLRLRVDIDPAGLPLSRLRSSLHAVVESAGEGGRRTVELAGATGEPPDASPSGHPQGVRARLDRDFVLRYTLGDGAVCTSLRAARDPKGGPEESFVLTLLPPAEAAPERPRDVVVVLDRSGSMGGWKMVAARRAAARIVDSLGGGDRFAVIAFDNLVDQPPALPADALSPATDRNRFRAVEFLAGLDARGGTEMAAPLRRAADLLGGGYRDRERILVLVTDGQIGNEEQILRELAAKLRGARVFPLGIDRAVNAGFLGRLAALGGGAAELVESEDRLDEVMDRIHRLIGTPVVTELSLRGENAELEVDSIAPRRLPDLLAGAPVVIRGRLRPGQGAPAILLRGTDRAGAPWQERVPIQPHPDGAACAALWARSFIRELEDRYAAGDAGREALVRRIVETSIRYSVLSRFTAFLAVDRSESVNPGGKLHRTIQPVEPASGWEPRDVSPGFLKRLGAPSPRPGQAMRMMGAMAAPGGPPIPRAPSAMPTGYAPSAIAGRSRATAGDPASTGQVPRRPAPPTTRRAAPPTTHAAPPPTAPPAPLATASQPPAPDLPARLRDLAERVAQRGAVHPAILADAALRDLDALAPDLAAAGRADAALRLSRAAHTLRALLAAGGDPAAFDRALAELEAALHELLAALAAGGPRPRDFWK